jgi:ribonuclease HI
MIVINISEFISAIDGTLPVKVFTDGACSGNPGPGGWAALLSQGGKHATLSGGELSTTNNRMELMSAIESLVAIPPNIKLDINTDSRYLKDGIERWLPSWKRNDWRTASKQPVKNRDLWERLDALCANRQINWLWVRGHCGNDGNEFVDSLAKQAIAHVIMNRGAAIA